MPAWPGLGDLGPTSGCLIKRGSNDWVIELLRASVGGGVELLILLSAENDDLNDLITSDRGPERRQRRVYAGGDGVYNTLSLTGLERGAGKSEKGETEQKLFHLEPLALTHASTADQKVSAEGLAL